MYRFVTQLGNEPGTDMAWCAWLVLEHESDNSGEDGKGDRMHLDKKLSEVDLDFLTWFESQPDDGPDEKDAWPIWLAERTKELEARGFKVVGEATYVFNSMQQ